MTSAPHSSTKISPFPLMLEYKSRAYPSLGKTFLPALENHLTTLEEVNKEALAAYDITHWILWKWVTRNFTLWKVGNKVWLEATNPCLHYLSRKLAPKWQGPFEITQVLSPLLYCLQLPPTSKIHDVFHASLLSSYKKTLMHGPNSLEPPPTLIDSEEEYEVD